MQLPASLRTALEQRLQTAGTRQLAGAVREVSQRYREHHGRTSVPQLRSQLEVEAYAAYRMPATYAAIRAALEEVRDRLPNVSPRTLLDIGGGPGTGAWAAVDIWPELERITVLERDERMIRLGKALAAHAESAALRGAAWTAADVTALWDVEPADLTIAAYVLGEIPADGRREMVSRLWAHTTHAGVALIVEPGTPRGFGTVRLAGDALAETGAELVAPFPHGWNCAEGPNDWCHFAERVPRTRIHRGAKEAALAYEDEKYSYVAASRARGVPIAGRVTRMPQIRSGHVRLVICTGAGVRHIIVTRKNREAYRKAKDLRWGSAISVEDAPLFGL